MLLGPTVPVFFLSYFIHSHGTIDIDGPALPHMVPTQITCLPTDIPLLTHRNNEQYNTMVHIYGEEYLQLAA